MWEPQLYFKYLLSPIFVIQLCLYIILVNYINCHAMFACRLGKQTWFVSAEDHTYSHVGSGSDGSCVCDVDNTCNDDRHKCNCDQSK